MRDTELAGATPFPDAQLSTETRWSPATLTTQELEQLHADHGCERVFRVTLPPTGSGLPASVHLTAGRPELMTAITARDGDVDLTDEGTQPDGEGASATTGRLVLDLLPRPLRRRLEALDAHQVVQFSHEFPSVDSTATEQHWSELTGRARREADGALIIEGAVRDITAVHTLREVDHEREDRARRMADAGSDVSLTLVRRPEVAVQWCSANARAVLGTPAHRIEGPVSILLQHVHPQDHAKAMETLTAPVEARVELRWARDPDADDWRWVDLLVVPVDGPTGSVAGLADARLRPTDSSKAAQQLARAAALRAREADAALEQLDAVRRHVTRAVSHRVRTPLAVLRAAADTGLSGAANLTPERVAALFDQVSRASQALTELLEDLLDLPDEDELATLRPRPMNVTDIVTASLHDVIGTSRVIHFETTGVIWAVGVPSQLQRALDHVLDNVIDHTPASATVMVAVGRIVDQVVIEVVDDGPGLPAEGASRALEAFVTGDAAVANPGLGLGLAIADRVVRAMAGSLTVATHAGGGTIVEITLPAWPATT